MMSPFHFILKCQYYYVLDVSLLAVVKLMIKFYMAVLKYSKKSRVSMFVSVVTCVKGHICRGQRELMLSFHLVNSKHYTRVLRLRVKHLHLLSRLTGLSA